MIKNNFKVIIYEKYHFKMLSTCKPLLDLQVPDPMVHIKLLKIEPIFFGIRQLSVPVTLSLFVIFTSNGETVNLVNRVKTVENIMHFLRYQ